MPNPTPYSWRFERLGGFDQVRFDTAEDYARLGELDQKLWAALACPVKGLEMDERTLSLVDGDGDGRIRAPEVVAAVKWAGANLNDLGALKAGSDSLPLARIVDKALVASAKRILASHGKADATAITLAEVTDTTKLFAETRFNGDGVVPPESAADEAVKRVLAEILDCMGPVPDRGGKPGVDRAKLDAFFADAAAHVEWAGKSVLPLGEGTTAAADAWKAVKGKADDFFARCRMAAFDPRALGALNRREEEYLALAAKDLSITAEEIAGFPLARVEAGRSLPLAEGINPAWASAVAALRSAAVVPVLGERTCLTEAEWLAIGAKLGPFEAWRASKPASSTGKLGLPRLTEILASKSKDAVGALIAEDLAVAPEFQAVEQVERLVRYHRDLHRLLVNFVNLSDFYRRTSPATFQAGTLFLDGRSMDLCVRVDDAGRHAALAGFAKAYLAYCDCTRVTGEKMTIAAAFTGGDSDFLMVGRNGVFYDRKGRDWDATIVRVVENPISVRQAFWFPYKKLVRMIEEMVAKRAASAEAAAQPDPTKKPPEPKKIDVGTVAAMGVAVGALGTLLATLVTYFMGLLTLPFWKLCLVIACLLLLVSLPSMLIAWLKLRQRNLAPILDANGWAVNGRVKLSVPFGGSLTSMATLPPGALPAAEDPYADRPSPWPKVFVGVLALCFIASVLNSFYLLHDMFGIGDERPAPKVETAPAVEGAPPAKPGDPKDPKAPVTPPKPGDPK